jgi:hypothetical protein
MSMRRVRRIGLSEADRLVAGARPDPGLEGLVGLLDAARSPTPEADLAGERAAVAGFLAARQRAVPTAPPRRQNRAVRTIAMKVALGFAVLAFGGTALAARTGSLPSTVQERAHTMFSDVGVPPPAPASPTQVTRGSVPTPTRAPSRTATPTPSERATLELCRVWDAARQDPPGKRVPPQTRRALADAAGGAPEIDGFCAALLGTASASATATATATATTGPAGPGQPTRSGKPTATPSHPGKGPGNGNGKSHGPGK